MKNVWTEVTIGGQKMPIVQLSNNGRLCLASDMNMQSCSMRVKQSVSRIPVQIKLYEGETVESLQSVKDVNIELGKRANENSKARHDKQKIVTQLLDTYNTIIK